MPTLSNPNDDEFEILKQSRSWIQRTFTDLSKASVAKQMCVGGATGWCTGYVSGKIGRTVAATIGGTLLLVQIAHHQGYVTINWGKLDKEMKSARKRFLKESNKHNISYMVEEVKDFVGENLFLAGAFAGGFLLGIAT